jgi:Spy/CpxP family protein refolding chaperone
MRPPAFLLLLIAAPAFAQHSGHHAGHHTADPSGDAPTHRSLSPQEAEGLLKGSGMGMARAAELNGHPGPMHVLELQDELALTAEQKAEAERLMREVKAEAKDLGEQIVAHERALDEAFDQGRATPALVDAMTAEIGALRGRLRAAHLNAHLAMREALTDEQSARYMVLRGHRPATD